MLLPWVGIKNFTSSCFAASCFHWGPLCSLAPIVYHYASLWDLRHHASLVSRRLCNSLKCCWKESQMLRQRHLHKALHNLHRYHYSLPKPREALTPVTMEFYLLYRSTHRLLMFLPNSLFRLFIHMFNTAAKCPPVPSKDAILISDEY